MKPKKLMGAALLTAVVVTAMNPVSAMYDPNQVNTGDKQNKIMTLSQELAPAKGLDYHLVINGHSETKDTSGVYISKQNQIMVPLRSVAEQLGYQLSWNQDKQMIELTKGNHWFMVKIGEDRYNFAKMFITLGAAPELKDGKTYVPLPFFSKVIKARVSVDKTGAISISDGEISVTKRGAITSIQISEKGGQVGINGFLHGVRLNISDETEIVSADNQKLSLSDLKVGMTIEVVHDKAMTMSLPPITNAKKVIVQESILSQTTLGTEGEITETTSLSDGTKRITVKGQKSTNDAYDLITLTISKETQIAGTKDNSPLSPDELKKGDKVYAFYGPTVTRSNPPIGMATKILVEK